MAIQKINKLNIAYFQCTVCLDENVLTLITARKNFANTNYHEFYNLTTEKR